MTQAVPGHGVNAITLILEVLWGALIEPMDGCHVYSALVLQGEGTIDKDRFPYTDRVAIGDQHCPSVPLLNPGSLQ